VLFDKNDSVYFIWKNIIYILALEIASAWSQHCANVIGTLSFPMNRSFKLVDGRQSAGQWGAQATVQVGRHASIVT